MHHSNSVSREATHEMGDTLSEMWETAEPPPPLLPQTQSVSNCDLPDFVFNTDSLQSVTQNLPVHKMLRYQAALADDTTSDTPAAGLNHFVLRDAGNRIACHSVCYCFFVF